MNENTIPQNEEQAPLDDDVSTGEASEETDAEPEAGLEPEAEPDVAAEPEPFQTQLLRLRADFDNYRKRVEREKAEWTLRANERLIESLLPVLDTFDLGLADAERQDAQASVVEGFRMVQSMLLDNLRKTGLQAIEAVGSPFDPNVHDAINRMGSEEVPADHVLFQSRSGYLLGEKLLRPAQVVVSTGSEVNEAAGTDDEQEA